MTKAELEIRHEKAMEDMAEIIEKISEQQLRIAYLEGVIDGADVKPKRRAPLALGPELTEEEMNKLYQEEFGDCDDDCKCPRCEEQDRKMVKQYGETKVHNLKSSSRDIRKWARENNVDVDNGDANDN